ncbi:MAG: GGDEF domain-containing protein [Anaerolineales bacterium]
MPPRIGRIRKNLISETQPVLRRFQVRMARGVIYALSSLFAAWLVADIVYWRLSQVSREHPVGYEISSLFALALLGGVSLWLTNRGRMSAAAHLLAATFFCLTGLSILLYPNYVYLLSTGFLMAIAVVGVIAGGKSPYIYAGLAIPTLALGWLRASGIYAAEGVLFGPTSGFIFLASQAAIYFGLAAVVYTFSRSMREVVEALHSKGEELGSIALTDPLTGLSNRRHLIEQLERELSRARRYDRPFSLLYIDLDGFKAVNDGHGHRYGDIVLRGIAGAMRSVLRSSDMIARIGGDEFAVLLPETELNGADKVASRLRRAVTGYCRSLGPKVPPISFCAGVSLMHKDRDSVDEIIARADEAQYLAKAAGQGQTRTELELNRSDPAEEA